MYFSIFCTIIILNFESYNAKADKNNHGIFAIFRNSLFKETKLKKKRV